MASASFDVARDNPERNLPAERTISVRSAPSRSSSIAGPFCTSRANGVVPTFHSAGDVPAFGLASRSRQSYAVQEGALMTKVTEAIYSRGVLKPAKDLGLAEDQRVRLIVETVEDKPEDRAAALARLKAGIEKMQFFSQGPLPSREELHDRS
jgi:predicted DNA-binding antitoxin AbrB/MazE fold protein